VSIVPDLKIQESVMLVLFY